MFLILFPLLSKTILFLFGFWLFGFFFLVLLIMILKPVVPSPTLAQIEELRAAFFKKLEDHGAPAEGNIQIMNHTRKSFYFCVFWQRIQA